MRLTTRTDLALRTLIFCAVNDERIVRKHEVAETCSVSENHLAQVVNGLSRKGFIVTMRGRNGGMRLARPMAEINVGTVARAFEEAPAPSECLATGSESCRLKPACRLRDALAEALEAFFCSLDKLTLGDLVGGNRRLTEILRLPPAVGHRKARASDVQAA